ncbi:MAG: hypothetical protein WC708_16700 [Lentisphaeria bacterium]
MGCGHRQLFCLSAVLTALALPAGARDDGTSALEFAPERAGLTMDRFVTRGVTAKDATPWRLEGEHAVIQGSQARLQGARLTFTTQEKDLIVITSPDFTFDRMTRSGHSEGPFHAEHRQFILDGVGYDVLADSQILHIRSQVQMRILGTGGLMDQDPLMKKLGRREAAPPARPKPPNK